MGHGEFNLEYTCTIIHFSAFICESEPGRQKRFQKSGEHLRKNSLAEQASPAPPLARRRQTRPSIEHAIRPPQTTCTFPERIEPRGLFDALSQASAYSPRGIFSKWSPVFWMRDCRCGLFTQQGLFFARRTPHAGPRKQDPARKASRTSPTQAPRAQRPTPEAPCKTTRPAAGCRPAAKHHRRRPAGRSARAANARRTSPGCCGRGRAPC